MSVILLIFHSVMGLGFAGASYFCFNKVAHYYGKDLAVGHFLYSKTIGQILQNQPLSGNEPSGTPSSTSTVDVPLRLYDLFMSDSCPANGIAWQAEFSFYEESTGRSIIKIPYFVFDDFQSNSKYMAFYVPMVSVPGTEPGSQSFDILKIIAKDYREKMKDIEGQKWAKWKMQGDIEKSSTRASNFSGRIYLYHGDDLSLEQLAELKKLYQENGATPIFRGIDYLRTVQNSIRLGESKNPVTNGPCSQAVKYPAQG